MLQSIFFYPCAASSRDIPGTVFISHWFAEPYATARNEHPDHSREHLKNMPEIGNRECAEDLSEAASPAPKA
jgi:hypothetical protein